MKSTIIAKDLRGDPVFGIMRNLANQIDSLSSTRETAFYSRVLLVKYMEYGCLKPAVENCMIPEQFIASCVAVLGQVVYLDGESLCQE